VVHPKARILFALLLCLGLAACSGGGRGGVTDGIGVENGTSLTVRLTVNGLSLATFSPGAGGTIDRALLPPLPWLIEARAPSGRTLLTLAVHDGDVGLNHGAGNRVDLSCGRLDVWSGPPIGGPAPLPGHSGDCDP
jgi:hypothetical protein